MNVVQVITMMVSHRCPLVESDVCAPDVGPQSFRKKQHLSLAREASRLVIGFKIVWGAQTFCQQCWTPRGSRLPVMNL